MGGLGGLYDWRTFNSDLFRSKDPFLSVFMWGVNHTVKELQHVHVPGRIVLPASMLIYQIVLFMYQVVYFYCVEKFMYQVE